MDSLINTKWVFNDTPKLDNITGFNINFTSNGHHYVKLTIEQAMNPNKELKYYQADGDVVDYPYHTNNGWQNQEFKTIVITDGQDIKNEELFAFLTLNATQVFLSKDVVLNEDNVDLFPRTKASLLVEDDGKTPWQGGGGSKLYQHNINGLYGGGNSFGIHISIINKDLTPINTQEKLLNALINLGCDTKKLISCTGILQDLRDNKVKQMNGIGISVNNENFYACVYDSIKNREEYISMYAPLQPLNDLVIEL